MYLNDNILKAIGKAYTIAMYVLNNHLTCRDIKKRIIRTILKNVRFPESSCEHGKSIKLKVIDKFVITLIFNYVKQINNVLHGKDLREITKNDPIIFQTARSWYIKYRRR